MHAVQARRFIRSVRDQQSITRARDELATVFLLESEVHSQQSLHGFLTAAGLEVRSYSRGRDFLNSLQPTWRGCVVMNCRLSDLDCFSVLDALAGSAVDMPVVLYGGKGKPLSVVRPLAGDTTAETTGAMAGEGSFAESRATFGLNVLDRVTRALRVDDANRAERDAVGRACSRLAVLSRRELEVAQMVVGGKASKVVAIDLGISERTVETHRRRVMMKTGSDSLAGLVWLFAATGLHEGAATWPVAELERFIGARAAAHQRD